MTRVGFAAPDAQETIFGKVRGRFDEVIARRAVMHFREEMAVALVAMSDDDLRAFIAEVNAMHRAGDRQLKMVKGEQ